MRTRIVGGLAAKLSASPQGSGVSVYDRDIAPYLEVSMSSGDGWTDRESLAAHYKGKLEVRARRTGMVLYGKLYRNEEQLPSSASSAVMELVKDSSCGLKKGLDMERRIFRGEVEPTCGMHCPHLSQSPSGGLMCSLNPSACITEKSPACEKYLARRAPGVLY